MTDKPWKLVLLLTGIFLAGGVAGGFVTVRVMHNLAQKGQPEQWGPNRLKAYAKRLELTPSQVETLRPIIKRHVDELNQIRLNGFREARALIEKMEKEIETVLTPDQKIKFEQMNQEMRERFQRARSKMGGPGGPPREPGPEAGKNGGEMPPPPPPDEAPPHEAPPAKTPGT